MQTSLQVPVHPYPTNKITLHIGSLHPSITEEVLWQIFKVFGTIEKIKVARNHLQMSKGWARITFTNRENGIRAQELNLTQLINSQYIQNQRYAIVCECIPEFREFIQHNVFIKGIPKETKPQELYNFLTQYGDIFSLYIGVEKKDCVTPAGYGNVLFKKKEDNNKIIEKKEIITFKGSELTFEVYVDPSIRNRVYKKNFYLKEFSQEELTDEQVKNDQIIKEKLDKAKDLLTEKISRCGKIQSLITNLDPKLKKIYAFVSFEDEETSNKFEENAGEYLPKGTYVNTQTNIQPGKQQIDDRVLIIKSLKPDLDEVEFLRAVGEVGEVSSYHFDDKTVNQQIKNSINAKLCHIGFKSKASAEEFLYTYLKNEKLEKYFVNNNPNGQVTIHLPAKERIKIKRQAEQHFKERQNLQQQIPQVPPFLPPDFQRMVDPNNNPRRVQQTFPPLFQAPRGFQQNRGGYQRQRLPQQQQQQRNQNQQQSQRTQAPKQPRIVQKQQQQGDKPNGPLTIETLKKNISQFLTLQQKEQSQILGNLIFPKVQALGRELKFNEDLAPKITGMLIDFSVFEVQDILENIENPEELKERVSEAVSLINEQENQ